MSAYRLLIADDENTIRTGLADYIPWDKIDCTVNGTARDGEEAIELIKSANPDIVIADIKMPRMDGIAVAKYVHENCPWIKVILLSGYAEFEYARSAIRFNVADYMLKPIAKDALMESVKKVIEQIKHERGEQKNRRNDEAYRKQQLLQTLIAGPPDAENLEQAAYCGIILDAYYAVIFECKGSGASSLDYITDNLTARYTNDYVFTSGERVFWLSGIDDAKHIEGICAEIVDIGRRLYAHDVSAGISAFHRKLAEVSVAAEESTKALTMNFYSTQGVSFYQNNIDANHDMHNFYTDELFTFEKHLKEQEFDKARQCMTELFSVVKSRAVPEFDVKTMCIQIYYICTRIVLFKGMQLNGHDDFFSKIRDSRVINTLTETMENLLETTGKILSNQGRAVSLPVKKALNYIHKNFQSDLSLEKIAGEIHINSSHLSRIFKKELNEPITEYINKLKIEKAKEILSFSSMLAYEVAEAVGFNDPSYFSQVFKKITGVSPTDYKLQSVDNPKTST